MPYKTKRILKKMIQNKSKLLTLTPVEFQPFSHEKQF